MFNAHQAAQLCSSYKNPFTEGFSTGDGLNLTGVVLSSQVWLPGRSKERKTITQCHPDDAIDERFP